MRLSFSLAQNKKATNYLIDYLPPLVGQRLQILNRFANDLLEINEFIIKHGLVY